MSQTNQLSLLSDEKIEEVWKRDSDRNFFKCAETQKKFAREIIEEYLRQNPPIQPTLVDTRSDTLRLFADPFFREKLAEYIASSLQITGTFMPAALMLTPVSRDPQGFFYAKTGSSSYTPLPFNLT